MAITLQKKYYSADTRGFTAGIANITPETGHLIANQKRILSALDTFSAEKVNLALFPEYCLSGGFRADTGRCGVHMADAALDRLLPWLEKEVRPYISDTLRYVVVNGPLPDGSGKFYNTTLVMDRSTTALSPGRIYRKTYLPGSEKKDMVSGLNNSLVIDTPYGRMGFLTCYDICFPQLLTDLVFTRGIDILVVPAAWRRQGERKYPGMNIRETGFYQRQWEMLLPALATQYQIWILAANGVGPGAEPDTDYCGRSGIWPPSGINLILASDREEELLVLKNMDIRGALCTERADFGCVADFHRVRSMLQHRKKQTCP